MAYLVHLQIKFDIDCLYSYIDLIMLYVFPFILYLSI